MNEISTRDLENWTGCRRPTNEPIIGKHIDILPYNGMAHATDLWVAFGGPASNDLLFHFGWPKLEAAEDLHALLNAPNQSGDYITCVFAQKTTGRALGMASYMAIVPEHGVVETGAVAHGSALRNTRAATEAHYLMARRVFDELGYRRYEWKLNNPNQNSHNAARRLGFKFEGVFRQHQVKPYGNRDTAWYSMLDREWPSRKATFEAWLMDENFDANGEQLRSLADFRHD